MRYRDGKPVHAGDRVRMTLAGGDLPGVVVCSMDDGLYTDRFPESEWAYLAKGVLVEFENGLLIHYEQDMEPDLELLARK